MAGIDQQGEVCLNGTVGQHVPMYMNMYLSVKIRGGLNTVSANITSVQSTPHPNFSTASATKKRSSERSWPGISCPASPSSWMMTNRETWNKNEGVDQVFSSLLMARPNKLRHLCLETFSSQVLEFEGMGRANTIGATFRCFLLG
jgi:hypothetical protein